MNSDRIAAVNSHGSGCTLSAAICACLALGKELGDAVAEAKSYMIENLTNAAELSQDIRVLNHFRSSTDC